LVAHNGLSLGPPNLWPDVQESVSRYEEIRGQRSYPQIRPIA